MHYIYMHTFIWYKGIGICNNDIEHVTLFSNRAY